MVHVSALLRSTAIATAALVAGVAIPGCAPGVDCASVCERTLACEVSFQPPDDPAEELVARGERSDQESCEIGCAASPLVDDESEACIATIDARDAAVCQDDVLTCLGADALD